MKEGGREDEEVGRGGEEEKGKGQKKRLVNRQREKEEKEGTNEGRHRRKGEW